MDKGKELNTEFNEVYDWIMANKEILFENND